MTSLLDRFVLDRYNICNIKLAFCILSSCTCKSDPDNSTFSTEEFSIEFIAMQHNIWPLLSYCNKDFTASLNAD